MAEKPSYEELEQRVKDLEKEIFELRQVKQALGESSEDIYSFLDELRDGFFVTAIEGTITYINKALGDLFGYKTPQEALGKHFSEHLSQAVSEKVIEKFNRAIVDEGYSELIEFPALKKDGSPLYLQLKHSPVVKGGKIVGTKGIIRDITRSKKAEKALVESDTKLRALLDAITETAVMVDPEGTIQAINKTAAKRFGRTVEQMTGKIVWDFMPSHLAGSRRLKGVEIIDSGAPVRFEDEREGEIYDTNVCPIFDGDGEVTAFAVFSIQITEQKRALNALRESEEMLRALLNAITETAILVDPKGTIQAINTTGAQRLGGTVEDLRGKCLWDHLPPHVTNARQSRLDIAVKSGAPVRFENERYGDIYDSSLYPMFDSEGKIMAFAIFSTQITEQKRAIEALRESEERYRSLFEKSHSVMMLVDPSTSNIVDANAAASAYYGYSREELTNKKITDINVHLREQIIQQIRGPGSETRHSYFFPHRLANGDIRNVECFISPITLNGKELRCTLVHDVTVRVKAEEALRESEKKYRLLIESMNDGLVVLDHHDVITYVNDRFLDMIGYTSEEVIGKHPSKFATEESAKKASKKILQRRKGKKGTYETTWVKKNGGQVPAILSASPIFDDQGHYEGSFAVIIDITDMKKIEQALRKRERELESKTQNLEEVNAALRVLLEQREKDKSDIEETLLFNVKELVIPYLERMRNSGLDTIQNGYLKILESNLTDIISPFSRTLSLKYMNLTPMEIQVASLIKQGRTTKEIAGSFHISSKTIEDHRKNIRKKLGITNRKTNLRTHLLSVQ